VITSNTYDLVVVGAGIVGAATAYEFQNRNPGCSVAVVEKESRPATQQTSHNSGVIHAGVYYKPGSMKARLCIDGRKRMLEFCEAENIPYRISGKLIVAIDESELPRLETLRERSIANGVGELEQLDAAQLREIEPNASGIAALHIPGTAVTDYELVTKRLLAIVEERGGSVRYDFAVMSMTDGPAHVEVRSQHDDVVRGSHVVTCTGTQADRTQRLLQEDSDFAILPFRGAYYELKPHAAQRVQSMIYPVPDPRFPFLGVHFTRHIDDSVSCGPNAVLSPARSGERRFAVAPRDLFDAMRFAGTWKLACKYWRECFAEMSRDLSKRRFTAAARRYMPDIEVHDLEEYHFGIRAQAVRHSGALIDDFDFARSGRTLFVRNAPSPAATASLAIAGHVLDELAASA
jgi:L-2-hydroxyglutarate oxidase